MIFFGVNNSTSMFQNKTRFQTYLSSKESFHVLKVDTSTTNGFSIESNTEGLQRFRIKLQQKIQLEDNPDAQCKNYKKRNEYSQVCKTKTNGEKVTSSVLFYINSVSSV